MTILSDNFSDNDFVSKFTSETLFFKVQRKVVHNPWPQALSLGHQRQHLGLSLDSLAAVWLRTCRMLQDSTWLFSGYFGWLHSWQGQGLSDFFD